MSRRCFLISAVLAVVFSACALSGAMAEYYYFDDFNTQLDPYWWTMSSSGSVNATYMDDSTNSSNKVIRMTYTPGTSGYLAGEGNLKFNLPQGNFSASINYNLFNWPIPDNNVTVAIVTDVGKVERLNNGAELYVTDFSGDGINSVTRSDFAGRLRIIRNGTILQGCYYNSTAIDENKKWVLIRQYNYTDTEATNITISLWPEVDANKNVSVVFDNFNFHAYDATDPRTVPEPISSSLFLLGAGALGARLFRRKKA